MLIILHSGSSSSLLRTTSPFSHPPLQLHRYLSSRPQQTRRAVPPPVSCNSFIHFSAQGFMSSRPPPSRCHPKSVFPLLSFHFSSLALKQSAGPLLGAQDTGRGPLLTTLCSAPERLIINRLKYSHRGVLLLPLAPMANTLVGTYCQCSPTDRSIDEPRFSKLGKRRGILPDGSRSPFRHPKPGRVRVHQALRFSLMLPGGRR